MAALSKLSFYLSLDIFTIFTISKTIDMKRKRHLFLLISFLLCNVCAWSGETKNPLSAVAKYNLNADGTFATGDELDIQGGYFKWADVKNVTPPEGYHLPTKEELIVISGIYPPDETTASPYPDLSWKIDKTGEETVTLFGQTMTLNAHYYGEGNYVCYALRFMGGDNKYLSAYRWEPIFTDDDTNQTKIKGLKVTCRLLGPSGAGLDVKELAKADYWTSGNAADVVRYFPACGYGNYTEDGTVMDVNSRGRYWSTTPRNKEATGAWGFGFDADFVMVYPWVASSRYCLRCFKNNTGEHGDTITTDAQIAMELNREGLDVNLVMAGPDNVEVDFGDGQRTVVNLLETQGVVAGTAKGTNIKIYAQGVTNFRATEQMIKSIQFSGMDKLKTLELGFNKLTELSLDGMPELEHLNAVSNRIGAIDLTKCPRLKYVSLSKNFYISELDLNHLTELNQLYVATNALTTIDLTPVSKLAVLDVSGNRDMENIDLSKVPSLEEFFASKIAVTALDLTHNPQLRRLSVAGCASLAAIQYSSLPNLQSCYLARTVLPKAQLDAFLAMLPNVTSLKVYANERVWKKQLELSEIPDVKAQQVDLMGAKNKGWKIDVLDDAWSVAPVNPCLVVNTNIPVGQDIEFNVENFYDPFWVDWGNWWSSFLQSTPYKITHAVRQPEIKYYSRGLMTLDCRNQRLSKLSLPDNDQTYCVDASSNELTEFTVSPDNALVTIDLRNNQLSSDALDALFNNLKNLNEIAYPFEAENQSTFPESDNFGKIFILGNPGETTCHGNIAIEKGYTLDVSFSGIDAVSTAALRMVYDPAAGTVEVQGTCPGRMISMYNVAGVKVRQVKAHAANQILSVADLAPGMYVVTVDGRSLKLVVR